MHYGFQYDTGLNHDWSKQEYICDMPADEIETWLERQLESYNKNDVTIGIGEPTKSDGKITTLKNAMLTKMKPLHLY